MLGIILIYFIGKYFYKLAEEFNKNKWVYAILGVIVYYSGTMVGGVLLGFADGFFELGIDWEDTLLLTAIALPFGIGAAYLFYYLLKKDWKQSFVVVEDEIENIGNEK